MPRALRFVHEGKCCSVMKTSRCNVKRQIAGTSWRIFERVSVNILYWARNPLKCNHRLTVLVQCYLLGVFLPW